MKKVINPGKVPIKMWLEDIEPGALEQARNLANLPFVFKHVALMPDAHQGYGMPIGGVLATHGVVIPNAVGVDIGCGMSAMKTNLAHITPDTLKKIMGLIRKEIPVGFNHNETPCDEALMPDIRNFLNAPMVEREYISAMHQLGTLGGGNHFIEIQSGSDGFIWIMIHSGSRNLGKRVADHYNKEAVSLNDMWHSSVPKSHDLAFLPIETDLAKQYMREMQYCTEFAKANREVMIQKVMYCIVSVIPDAIPLPVYGSYVLNIAHNYARFEHHFGRDVIVHRKGATSARAGEIGIIPGSQGSKSYIVEGLGNHESFMSCSHGAGRRMGRKEAQRSLSLEDEIRKMDEQGIIHGMRNTADLDEAAGAYKDIDVVMANQEDLVKVLVELKPMAVIKG